MPDARQEPSSRGLRKRQELQLRSRKVISENRTDEEKWRHIVSILFPLDEQAQYLSPCKLPSNARRTQKLAENEIDYESTPPPQETSFISPASRADKALARFVAALNNEQNQQQLRCQVLDVLKRGPQAPDLNQMADEIVAVVTNSQMAVLQHVRSGDEEAPEFSAHGADLGTGRPLRLTRQSSSSSDTLGDSRESAALDAENVSQPISDFSTPERPSLSTPHGSDSASIVSNLDWAAASQQGIGVNMQPPTDWYSASGARGSAQSLHPQHDCYASAPARQLSRHKLHRPGRTLPY